MDQEELISGEESVNGESSGQISVPDDEDNNKKNFRITIEPVLTAVFLSQCLSDSVLTDLFLKRTCVVELKYNDTICSAFGQDTPEGRLAEKLVQPVAAEYLMWKMILQSVLPACLSFFLGPWTDTNGRKRVIACPLIGCSLMYAIYTILSYIPHLHPGFILLGIVPLSFLGGYVNLISASYCYISDTSSLATRSRRLGILEGFLFIGMLVGLSSSSYIFYLAEKIGYGYFAIFGLSSSLCFMASLYLIYFVPESVNLAQLSCERSKLFDLRLPLEMIKTCIQKRKEGRRIIVFLCILTLGFCILTLEGESQVFFLFSRYQFQWELREFTLYTSAFMVVTIFGTVLGCWLMPTYLKFSDELMAFIAFSFDVVQCVIIGLAGPHQSYFLYIGGAVGALRGVVGPAVRSILSKTVPQHELGKVFALTSSVEAVMPILASFLYVQVYNGSIDVLPGAFLLLSAGFYVICIVSIGVISIIQKVYRHSRRDTSQETVFSTAS